MARSSSLFRTALIAGVVAGMLDVLEAAAYFWLRSHASPMRRLQNVASGVLGRSAYSGGWLTALLGLAVFLGIAFVWAIVFVFLARYVPILREHAVPAGMIYGFVIFTVMSFVVVPHLHFTLRPGHALLTVFHEILAVVFLVGLPIALITRRSS
jgi:hypothetical protein